MTPSEAQVLLSMAATVDNRKPDEDAAKAWAALLSDCRNRRPDGTCPHAPECGLRFADCQMVVAEHFKKSSEWLTPAIIRAEVKRIREKRLADHPEPTPPPDLAPGDYQRWLKDVRRQIADGNPPETPAQLTRERDMGSLRSAFRTIEEAS